MSSDGALVEHQLGHDPYAGDVFVFIGRKKCRMKVLLWDASGFWLCARRLESGIFAVPRPLLAVVQRAWLARKSAMDICGVRAEQGQMRGADGKVDAMSGGRLAAESVVGRSMRESLRHTLEPDCSAA